MKFDIFYVFYIQIGNIIYAQSYACEKGFYGPNCTRGCGHCKGKAKCDHVNGSCPSRKCKPGWKQTSDRKCDQACEKGFYGPNCTHDCGHCKVKAKCDHVNGSCPS
ncbi:scavenger receptor class F member 2-like [Ostrea edulis]|uniref:scavenger receptor class F member 2-like n=1 Tax=Ostrea edulis TaxID=37623 RepID=UPI0024AFF79D|nr:scavenger receptor class F member 2-like [Ostrea edulis]